MAELGSCCAGLGIGLQWLRAFARVPDQFTVTLGVLLALALWALGFDWVAAKDWQAAAVHSLPIIGTFVSSLLGGMYTTSNLAKAAVAGGADPASLLVPHTDSK